MQIAVPVQLGGRSFEETDTLAYVSWELKKYRALLSKSFKHRLISSSYARISKSVRLIHHIRLTDLRNNKLSEKRWKTRKTLKTGENVEKLPKRKGKEK